MGIRPRKPCIPGVFRGICREQGQNARCTMASACPVFSPPDSRRFAPLVAPAPTRKAPDKHRGAQAELIACAYLLGEGYEVFRNISPCGSADIIACKGSELRRIDVKSGTYHPQLTEVQRQDGVVILYVAADGGCEFDFEREQRYAASVRARSLASPPTRRRCS
jgi:hypothetical protein